jgi:MFS family permease
VYQLYVSYGFTQQQIAELFVCGFGSSMVVGTFVGGLADKLGRKGMCIVYCLCYIAACLTKLVPEYWTLMLGRFLSGIATSLLFSVFESWMVCEHAKSGFEPSLLGQTFSYATFGNGLVAVIAGLVANTAAESYGFVAPFILALLPLTCVAFLVSFTWEENYGNAQLDMFASLSKGFSLIRSDSRIAALGAAQSCFEGAMYTFVFMWTPALKTELEKVADEAGDSSVETTSQYLGLIFAVFMVSVMVGSSVFSLLSTSKAETMKIPLYLHGAAFVAMALITIFLENKFIVYCMFLVFETSVGLFYPAYGVIKSEKIPEDIRSAVMNIFRIPLNLFVVLLLLKIKYFSSETVFAICTITHGAAFAFYSFFYYYESKAAYTRYDSLPDGDYKNDAV